MVDVHELSKYLIRHLIENVDWKIEEERFNFIRKISSFSLDRLNDLHLINLQDLFEDVFVPEGHYKRSTIEGLLFDAVDCELDGEHFIRFVALTGYRDTTHEEVESGSESEQEIEYRDTPLHYACRNSLRGRDNMIADLFKIYDDFEVNYVDLSDGLSHFHVACAYNHIDIVRSFLVLRRDPDITWTDTGDSPIHIAVCRGLREVTELLLIHGADPNMRDLEKATPLHLICTLQDVAWATMFFRICSDRDEEVEIDAQDCLLYTPLMAALSWGKRELVELLLRHGADPNLADTFRSTALHTICDQWDLDSARRFFEICAQKNRQFEVNAQDENGYTPLIVALRGHKRELVEFLLSKDADPNLADNEGATALHTICNYREDGDALETARTLFEASERLGKPLPLIDAQDGRGNTPLHLAAMRDKTQLVAYLLLSRGASPNLANATNRRTFLHLIGRSQGNVDSARRLFELEERRDQLVQVVDARDAMGDTPLHSAARNRNGEAIELLLRRGGADPNLVNARKMTPLHEILLKRSQDKDSDDNEDEDMECLAERFIEIVEDVGKSVQVNAQDENGDAPLHLALRRGRKKEARVLLSRGANPNLANATGKTAMFIVCNRAKPNENAALELAEMVFESSQEQFKPLQLDVRDENRQTALFCPLRRGEKRLVQLLLARGIDPNLANSNGNALHHAVLHNCDVDVVRLIFEQSQRPPNINARNSRGLTPLLMAVLFHRDEVFELLLRRGADPNVTNVQGETVVHHACKFDYKPELCSRAKALFAICSEIRQPVSIDAEDNEGRTPLQWAVARHSPIMVDLLVDQGADLSSFLFPTESYLNSSLRAVSFGRVEKKFILASGMMAVVDRLEARGYELDRSDTLTIMKLFSEWGLYEDPADHQKNWYDDEELATEARQMMVERDQSLYKLIHWRTDRPRGSMKYYEFARTLDWLKLSERFRDVCARNLCEKASRGFFKERAVECFSELVSHRLSNKCCGIILDGLTNRQLRNVCLAACLDRSSR